MRRRPCPTGRGPRRSRASWSCARRACPTACTSTATTCGGPRAAPRRAAASRCCAAAPDGSVDEVLPADAQRPHRGARVRRRRVVGARRRALVRRLGDPAAAPPRARRRARRRSRPSRRSPRGLRYADGDRAPRRHDAALRPGGAPRRRRARPPTRSCGSPPTSRARPRWWWRAPTSCPTRAGRPTATAFCWLEWDHPDMPWDATRLVVDDGRRRAPSWPAATSGSRSASRRGRPTARSGSSATAPGSGACTAGRRTAGARPMVDLGTDIGFPQWVFGQSLLRVPRRRPGRLRVLRRRPRAPRGARARTAGASRPSTCPHTLDRRARRPRVDRAVCIAAGPTTEPHVVAIDVDAGAVDVLVPPRDLGLDRRLVPGARADLVPDRRRRDRPRAAVPAHQPRRRRRPTASARRCS